MGLRDDILAADDIEIREVKIPEWDTTVWIHALSGEEWDAWRSSLTQWRGSDAIPQMVNMRAKLLVLCLYDAAGEKIFTRQDANVLGKKSSAVLERLFDIATDISGVSEDADQAIADAEGNSVAAQSGDSTSSLPDNSDAPSLSS